MPACWDYRPVPVSVAVTVVQRYALHGVLNLPLGHGKYHRGIHDLLSLPCIPVSYLIAREFRRALAAIYGLALGITAQHRFRAELDLSAV